MLQITNENNKKHVSKKWNFYRNCIRAAFLWCFCNTTTTVLKCEISSYHSRWYIARQRSYGFVVGRVFVDENLLHTASEMVELATTMRIESWMFIYKERIKKSTINVHPSTFLYKKRFYGYNHREKIAMHFFHHLAMHFARSVWHLL